MKLRNAIDDNRNSCKHSLHDQVYGSHWFQRVRKASYQRILHQWKWTTSFIIKYSLCDLVKIPRQVPICTSVMCQRKSLHVRSLNQKLKIFDLFAIMSRPFDLYGEVGKWVSVSVKKKINNKKLTFSPKFFNHYL